MKVYLAGPEVFLPNARAILDEKIAVTKEYGFVPVSPGDLEIPASIKGQEKGFAISKVNERLMLSADKWASPQGKYRSKKCTALRGEIIGAIT